MADANFLLFEKPFRDGPLFKSQLDLVLQLLSTPAYFVKSDEKIEHQKALSRLKAYVSQLLSSTATRTITDDFLTSMKVLLTKKIPDQGLRENTITEIFEDLKAKNVPGIRADFKQPTKHTIQADVTSANYVAIISANPINTERPYRKENEFSIRQLFVEDLLMNLALKDAPFKKYRFNFPLESHCENFWSVFEKMLIEYLEDFIDNQHFIDTLYEKFAIKTNTHTLAEWYQQFKKVDLQNRTETKEAIRGVLIASLASNIVELLNRNNIVAAYQVSEPIYSITIVAINPNELGAGKLYYLAMDDQKKVNVIKTTTENVLLWTLFVWANIKSTKLSKPIFCPALQIESIKNSGE